MFPCFTKEIKCNWFIKWSRLGKQAGNNFMIFHHYFKQLMVDFLP